MRPFLSTISLTLGQGFPLCTDRHNTKILFSFSLQPGESYLQTVMLLVLLVYILNKVFYICKRFVVHCNLPLCFLDIRNPRCIVPSICDLSNYLSKHTTVNTRRDEKQTHSPILGVVEKGWPSRSKSGT